MFLGEGEGEPSTRIFHKVDLNITLIMKSGSTERLAHFGPENLIALVLRPVREIQLSF